VSRDGVATAPDKINAIREWPTPSTIHEARGFHDLAIFYRRFVRDLVVAPITDCLKKGGGFKWTKSATKEL